MCGLSEINVVSNRDGRLGWETDCDGRIRKGCNTKGPRQGDLLWWWFAFNQDDQLIIVIVITMIIRWSSMTWRLTLGRSCPRSWRREDTPFSRFQCQGEHNGSGDGEDKEDGEDDNGDCGWLKMFWPPGNYSAHRRRELECGYCLFSDFDQMCRII